MARNFLTSPTAERSIVAPTFVGNRENSMRIIKVLLTGLALFGFVTVATAQDTKAYKEGPVTQLSYIKIKPGKFDEYMKFLGGNYKKLMDAYVKAGLVVRYGVYSARPRNPNEPDLILTVTSPNFAALDKVDEREAIAAKLVGSSDAQAKATIDRGAMREILGGELLQELILK